VLELAILGVLQEQPLHGYELKKRLSEMLGFFSGVSFGSLYPALRRLEKAGSIEVVTGRDGGRGGRAMPATGSLKGEAAAARLRLLPGPSSRRPRKAYRITDHGRTQFLDLLGADDGADDERLFTLKLAYCRYLDPEARLDLLGRRRSELVDRLQRARRTRAPEGAPVADRYTNSLIEHRTRSIERELEWIDGLIDQETQHQTRGPGGAPAGPAQHEGATA
jgi:DNA-binding PadR family transcriptional regulator